MGAQKDLAGHRFGSVVIVGRAPMAGATAWRVRCDCGHGWITTSRIIARGNGVVCKACNGLRAQTERASPHSILYDRPRTRADCLPGGCNAERPCPWVSCRYNTYCQIDDVLSVPICVTTPPDIEPGQVDPRLSCVLDAAESGGLSMKDVGRAFGLTQQRAEQIEAGALEKFRLGCEKVGIDPRDMFPVGEDRTWLPSSIDGGRQRQRSDGPEPDNGPCAETNERLADQERAIAGFAACVESIQNALDKVDAALREDA